MKALSMKARILTAAIAVFLLCLTPAAAFALEDNADALQLGAAGDALQTQSSASVGFDDVSGHWVSAEGWLSWVSQEGLMSGYSGTSHFGPDDDLTRAQAVTILYRFSLPDNAATTDTSQYADNSSGLPDNKSKQYYTAAVNWAVAEGVVTGYRNDAGEYYAFGPDDPVTREQLATILCRFAQSRGVSVGLAGATWANAPDAASVSEWAKAGVGWAFTNGVMTGDASTKALMPRGHATRAAMAKMVTVALRDVVLVAEDFNRFAEAASKLVRDAGVEPDPARYAMDEFYSRRLIVQDNGEPVDYSKFGAIAAERSMVGLNVVQFGSSAAAREAFEAIKGLDNVLWVESDGVAAVDANSESEAQLMPTQLSEPILNTQASFHSWGVSAMGADKLAAALAASSESVTVAVVDSGVFSGHPMFNGRMLSSGKDYVEGDNDPNDGNGHGTHVAGTIVDCTPGLNVKVLPVRVFDYRGCGWSSSISIGTRYAVDNGAHIINLSCSSPHRQCQDDEVRYALSKGVTVVAAAGNQSGNTANRCPAHMQEPIVVGSINLGMTRSSFSNVGASVDVVAPGERIESCALNGGFRIDDGTSMATPHVSAAAAMLKLADPLNTPQSIEQQLKDSAKDLGTIGWDQEYGYGLPDLTRLIRVVVTEQQRAYSAYYDKLQSVIAAHGEPGIAQGSYGASYTTGLVYADLVDFGGSVEYLQLCYYDPALNEFPRDPGGGIKCYPVEVWAYDDANGMRQVFRGQAKLSGQNSYCSVVGGVVNYNGKTCMYTDTLGTGETSGLSYSVRLYGLKDDGTFGVVASSDGGSAFPKEYQVGSQWFATAKLKSTSRDISATIAKARETLDYLAANKA